MNESERLLHFAQELTTRLGGAVKEMVPPEAQYHLLNAQRELLTALFLIYEHQSGARRGGAYGPPPRPARPRRRAGAADAAGASGGAPRRRAAAEPDAAARPRVTRIEIQ